MTLDCVRSIKKFGPPVKEILLISNNSNETELGKIRENISDANNLKLIEYNQPFNYQKINNWAVKQSSGKFIF